MNDKNSSDRFRLNFDILDLLPTSTCLLKHDFSIQYWNEAMERATGYSREFLLGRSILEIYPSLAQPKYRLRIETVFSSGAPYIFSPQLHEYFIPIPYRSGTFRRQHTVISGVRNPRADGYLALISIQDVTTLCAQISELKKLRDAAKERQEEAERERNAKAEFLANMSHEIRTPLTGVLGMTDLVLETELTLDQREYLETIKTSGRSLLGILNDILDLSKIESGKFPIVKSAFSLRPFLSQLEKIYTVQCTSKQMFFHLIIDHDVPDTIVGDETRLCQVLMNLLGNALKFTRTDGTITLMVSNCGSDEKYTTVRFAVLDTGIGISEQNQKGIFEAFQQADPTIFRKYGGTGLGLSISTYLIRLMGGDALRVQSKEGIGSVFFFEISFEVSAASERAPRESGEASEVPRDPLRILLCEDNTVNQTLARRLLEKDGHIVIVAPNGSVAIDLLKEQTFDLVLMDIEMPVMGGIEATRCIRSNPQFQSLPIIALTANACPGDKEKYLGLGMDSYLSKPFDRESLRRALREAV